MVRVGRAAGVAVVGTALFAFSWLLRFNDPGGAFAGLTDDHFFYLVRGWQILFGDLPVRDFVDHGAPLYYYIAAAVQQWFGRGTLSEVTFAVSVLSLAATLTFWLAARASGSIVCGAAAALVQILLEPRFYNYPKLLIYTVAIPILWRFADRPAAAARFWLALVTVLAFLFRHDHGPFVATTFAVLLVSLRDLHWRTRVRHALVYVALVLALLSPYLLFIQLNGGLGRYFQDASAWAARDRERAPLVWPGLFESPAEDIGAETSEKPLARAVATVRDNFPAWMFYVELALPLVAVVVLASSRDGFRASWPRAVPKLTAVAALGILLNAGFLRHPLEGRVADPFVPHAIILAWLMATVGRTLLSDHSLRPNVRRWSGPLRGALVFVTALLGFVLVAGLSKGLYNRLEKAYLVKGPAEAIERVGRVRQQLRADWRLTTWQGRRDKADLIELSAYLNACTRPDDRVFIQHYAPQVLGLAQRAFAGGHADLRPGFFTTLEAQRLTLERLRRQQVPVMLLDSGDAYEDFRSSFPLIAAYADQHYRLAGTRIFDRRFGIQLFVRNNLQRVRTYDAFGWPCFS